MDVSSVEGALMLRNRVREASAIEALAPQTI
jgi:hypothetical protein